MSKKQIKQINLNEDYALTADSMNIVLLVQTKGKDGNGTGNYRTLGYYASTEACIKRLQNEVLLSTLQESESLERLVNVLEDYLSKLHDNVCTIVKTLRSDSGGEGL